MRANRPRTRTHPPTPHQQSSSSTIMPYLQRSLSQQSRRMLDSSEASEADGGPSGRKEAASPSSTMEQRKSGAVAEMSSSEANENTNANTNSFDSGHHPDPPIISVVPSTNSTSTNESSSTDSTFEATAKASAEWGMQHEIQIKALEAKLANELSNSRAIHNLILEALTNIESNTQRVDRALNRHIPHIHKELHSSLSHLLSLSSRFPTLHTQVQSVRAAYDRGRTSARHLQHDLEWTHAPLGVRLQRTLFTRRAPVSALEAALTRLAFAVVVLLCAWQVGNVLEGAYRAYRHRLVWGDKLIS